MPVHYELVKENGAWKIKGMHFRRKGCRLMLDDEAHLILVRVGLCAGKRWRY